MRFIVELGIEEGPDPDPTATAADLERFIESCRFSATSTDNSGYVAWVTVEPIHE